MSKANIKKFYSMAIKDQALVAKMWKGTSSTDDFIRNAMKEAKSIGYEFTFDEGKDWWNENRRLITEYGELLDNQIELVRSGKNRG